MEAIKKSSISLVFVLLLVPTSVFGRFGGQGTRYLQEASKRYHSGDYLGAAQYAFAANESDAALKSSSYAWITMGLVHAGMPNAASYFFIRALQSGNKTAIRSVLTQSQELFMTVGPDLIRQYMVRHTRPADYDEKNRPAFYYVLGKNTLLSGDYAKAIQYLAQVKSNSPFWPYALQLKATAYAVSGQSAHAIDTFKQCANEYRHGLGFFTSHNKNYKARAGREAEDLKARCQAGAARTLYEIGKLGEADQAYDEISKQSIIWTDILSEQAWNAFSRKQYNRSLGKLVAYKSPSLQFVFNPEIDVLTAQSYLGLCLYSDANAVLKAFNHSYQGVGEEVKRFVERNPDNLGGFFAKGKAALSAPLHTRNEFYRVLNRFVRGPYFQSLVAMEGKINSEQRRLLSASSAESKRSGFAGFLAQVLQWRLKAVSYLGGAFVKNSLIDYHTSLLDQFDKMAFIKLEMLKRAKTKLLAAPRMTSEAPGENSSENQGPPTSLGDAAEDRALVEPERRDDQLLWDFNGEFWADEMGDLVFGLQSACE